MRLAFHVICNLPRALRATGMAECYCQGQKEGRVAAAAVWQRTHMPPDMWLANHTLALWLRASTPGTPSQRCEEPVACG